MISVIIPHLEQPGFLRECLRSLSRQENLTDEVEIIVVDNGSRVPPGELCAEFGARLLTQPVPGPGPARNLGAARASGELLAFIDADCIAAPDWLAEIAKYFRDHPDAEIVGGDVRIGCENLAHPTWLEAYESIFAYRMKEYIAREGFTGTGNLAVRRTTFEAVGPFGGIEIAEDLEWGKRALRLGRRTRYCQTMVAFHPARKNFSEIAGKWQRHIAHDLEATRRQPGWRARWLAKAVAVALSPAFEVLRISQSDRVSGVRSRLLAFGGVVLIRLYRARVMCGATFAEDSSSMARRWNRA